MSTTRSRRSPIPARSSCWRDKMITVNLYYTGVDANARKFAEEMKKAVRRIGSARKRVT